MKHQALGWQLANLGDGTLAWTTPTARTITIDPDQPTGKGGSLEVEGGADHEARPPPAAVETAQGDHDPPV